MTASSSTISQPEPTKPKDFGRHLINDESYSDFVLKLKDERELKVSTEVLKHNSAVFKRLIDDLQLTCHEMNDFEGDAVTGFVDCVYTGSIQLLDRSIFREVNKMARVFEVAWLVGKCADYFRELLDKAASSCVNQHKGLLLILEEAVFVKKVFKEDSFLSSFILQMRLRRVCNSFLRDYMESHELDNLSSAQIEMIIHLADKNDHILVPFMIKSIIDLDSLSPNTQYLLENIDLSNCLMVQSQSYHELFKLLSRLKDLDVKKLRLILDIQRESIKRGTMLMMMTQSSEIPVAFFCPFVAFSELSFTDLINELGESEMVRNLYMYIDGLCFWMYINHKTIPLWTDEIAQMICLVKGKHKWRPISKQYLEAWEIENHNIKAFFQNVVECTWLVSSTTLPLTSVDSKIAIQDLFFKSQTLRFDKKVNHPHGRDVIEFIDVKTSIPRENEKLYERYRSPNDHLGRNRHNPVIFDPAKDKPSRVIVDLTEESLHKLDRISEDGLNILPHELHLSVIMTLHKVEANQIPLPPGSWINHGRKMEWALSGCAHMWWEVDDNYGGCVKRYLLHGWDEDYFKAKLYF